MVLSSSTQNLLSVTLVLLLFLLPSASSISFNFTSFAAGDIVGSDSCSVGTAKICVQGNATHEDKYNSIQFTNGMSNSGWAVYSDPMPVSVSGELTNFTTTFFVNLTKNPSDCTNVTADGLAFFLSPYPFSVPPSSDDGKLGLVSGEYMFNASAGGSPFVAVEIDTYTNPKWDPHYPHLGIDVNSIRSVEDRNLTNLAAVAPNKLDIVAHVRVDYSSVTKNLTATVERAGVIYAKISYNINLTTVLPSVVAVGLSATSGYCPEYHKVMSWSFNSTWDYVPNNDNGGTSSKSWVIALSVVVPVVALVGLVWFCLRRRKPPAKDHESAALASTINETFDDAGVPRSLNYEDLVAATENFAESRKLGAGGSGAVYRGFLSGQNREVAIKRVTSGADSQRGRKEYMAEVKIISQLRHRNLVQLVGWCHEKGELLLAYELMPNLSLDQHLFGTDRILQWPERYVIATGVASAMLYLHEEADRCVVHRDIKSSNVMLDETFRAKLGDFGLARLTEHGHGLQTTMLGGTLGYMAPECFYTGRASTESDVYSFGVVALEIATGKRAIDEKRDVRLVKWVWDLFAREAILEAADERLEAEFDREQMERLLVVGLWCVHPDASSRPSIRKVMAALNMEDVKIEVPKQMPVPIYAVPSTVTEMPSDSLDTFSSIVVDYSVTSLYESGR